MIELTLSGSLSIHMKFFGVPKAHSTRHSLNLGKHKSSTKPAISTALKWLFTSNDSRNHNQKQKSGIKNLAEGAIQHLLRKNMRIEVDDDDDEVTKAKSLLHARNALITYSGASPRSLHMFQHKRKPKQTINN